MRAASSLSNRIFLACTLLATFSLGLAFWFVNARVTSEAEEDLSRTLDDMSALVNENRTITLTDAFTRDARFVADIPKLKAAVETKDPPTVLPLAKDYREQMNVDLLIVTAPDGTILGSVGAEGVTEAEPPAPDGRREWTAFVPHPKGLLQLLSVPIQLGVDRTEFLGRLTVGLFLDHDRAVQFKRLASGSEVAFGAGNRILAASLPPDTFDALRTVMTAWTPATVRIRGVEYLARAMPMVGRESASAAPDPQGPVMLVLRSRTEQLRILGTLRAGLAGGLLVAVFLATIVSFVVARTITRPLAAVTGAMADVAATGDLTRRVAVQSRAWDDEDARLLASAFNTLTESIARFRTAETQRERLSSLGRLSTVIAHEIRNPLMIIRTSLRALGRDDVTPAERREAIADIDEETARLNRIVSEVLDFAKPLRFELDSANVNEICRASAAAASAGGAHVALVLDLDPEMPAMITDAERLRTALVNILTNARHAVLAASDARRKSGTDPAGAGARAVAVMPAADVQLQTAHRDGRVLITIEDAGVGITAEDMAHIFDPYFTTRRAGTGLGLPIARNIVEGLGGTIAVSSQPGAGTRIVIDLPVTPPGTLS